jgi:hypothetical protein
MDQNEKAAAEERAQRAAQRKAERARQEEKEVQREAIKKMWQQAREAARRMEPLDKPIPWNDTAALLERLRQLNE